MKKVILYLALVLPMLAVAGERSAKDAAAMAAEFMNQQVNVPARRASVGASAMQLSHTRQKLNSAEPAFYVFNQANKTGYVVVSADDRTEDVLMYSDKGALDVEKANPNLKFWLNRLQEEISAVNDENGYTAAEKLARKAVNVTAIAPLLVNADGTEITWYQEEPYWNQCPKDDGGTCLTGCVATAAAQIMYKWRYPEKGTGTHSYSWNSTTLSQDFSKVTFDWANMLPAYDGVSSTTAQQNAVATLMWCCGVACNMDYSSEGSGAYTDDMGQALVEYFGYKAEKFITMYSNKQYGTAAFSPAEYSVTRSTFETYFNADLEAGRPIIMGGGDNTSGGHEFVCDGRNSSGYFHINWGWEGECNNYCLLSALKPSGYSYGFAANLDAMIGLEPATTEPVAVTGVSVAPTTLTLKQKAKATLTATVAPSDATDKSVTWSSSDSKIAAVDASGVVTGVAEGNATITVTTTDGSKKATCAVTVTNEIIETTDCEKYSYTFTSKCSTGSNTLGAYTWNIVLNAGDIQSIDGTKGQQLGSSKSPCGQASLTTSNTAECLINTVKVNASIASSGDGKLAIYIGGTQVGEQVSLTTAATEYTFSNSASVQGNLEIRLTNSAKAMYIKQIEVNPDGGGGDPVPVTAITAKNAKDTVQVGDKLTLGYTITPESATDQRVEFAITSGAEFATLDNGKLTGVAEGDVVVKVTALDSLNQGNKLTATYNIHVIGAQFNTCAEANAAASGTALKLNEVTVVYVNGAYVYVKDASGSTLVYKTSAGLIAGDVVSGIVGTASPYYGLPELKPTNTSADWTITAGQAPAIPAATAAPVANEVNKVMVWKGVSGLSGEFTTSTMSNLTGSFKGEDVIFRNNFKIAQTFDATKTYNITGAVAIYSKNETTTIQVYFIAAEEVVAPTEPSDELLNSYAEAGQNLVYAIQVPAESTCNDIVLVGTYNGWTGNAASCSKFVAVEGYENWYVCCVADASEDIQAKPVQLDGAGAFRWDYQLGADAEVVRGTATITPGYFNECDIKAIDDSAPLLIQVNSWKNDPCAAVYHDYVITLVSPDCNEEEFVVPAISGGFNDWAQQAMTMDEDATYARQQEGLPGAVFTVTAHAAEGTQYKFRSSEEWGKDWTNELKQFNTETSEWEAFNGGENITLGADTVLTFDLGDPSLYSWSSCERPLECDSMDYTITVKLPASEITTPQIIGSFDGWTGTELTPTGNANEYTATIWAICTDVYKFNDAVLGWDNELQYYDGTSWNALSNIPLGSEASVALDFSGSDYRWSADTVAPVVDGIVFNYESIADTNQVKSNVNVVLAKGTGSAAPAWSSDQLRLYVNNTIKVTGKAVQKVELTFTKTSKSYAELTASTGVLTSGGTSTSTTDEKTDTWTGKADQVIFTLGTGQRAVKKIVVYLGEPGGADTTVVNFTNATVELVDYIADMGVYQFVGSSDDNQYLGFVAMQDVSSVVGKVTADNLLDYYTALYYVEGTDTTEVEYDAFLGGEVVKNGAVYVADFNFQIDEEVFVLHYEYEDSVTLQVVSSDKNKGIVFGGGTFEAYSATTIAAAAYEGYRFDRWSDGNTAQARELTLSSDSVLIAYFRSATALDTVYVQTLEVNSMNPLMGTVMVQLLAVPESGYKFTTWDDLDTSNPRTIELTDEPQSFTAMFDVATSQQEVANQADDHKKVIKNNQLYILHQHKIFNVHGSEVK